MEYLLGAEHQSCAVDKFVFSDILCVKYLTLLCMEYFKPSLVVCRNVCLSFKLVLTNLSYFEF